MRPLKNGFAAAQKSFSLLVCLHIIVIYYQMLNSITERRKTFDSLLANHFSAVMQDSQYASVPQVERASPLEHFAKPSELKSQYFNLTFFKDQL